MKYTTKICQPIVDEYERKKVLEQLKHRMLIAELDILIDKVKTLLEEREDDKAE